MYKLNSALKSNFINTEAMIIDCQKTVKFSHKWSISLAETYELSDKVDTDPLIELLCSVFKKTSDIPSDIIQLYQEGLEILLKKWDKKCQIEGDRVYKNLSLQQKQDLFSQIALKTFKQGEYFHKRDVEQCITDYIRNLPHTETHPEVLEAVSETILKSIKSQHGILVERIAGVYYFSDIRFHQYFTARAIIENSEPLVLEQGLKNLVSYIDEPEWREVFLLVTSMLRSADYLLSLIKHKTNAIAALDPQLQYFLIWLNQESQAVKAKCKPAIFRACCLEFILNLDLATTQRQEFAYNNSKTNSVLTHTHTKKLQKFPFTQQQKVLLKQYYDANKLLLDCLSHARYVMRPIREEIKETMLVPLELGVIY